MIVFISGVCGIGKTSVAELATRCCSNAIYVDADDYHSEENKEKMRKGIPLSDSDRLPWLNNLCNAIAQLLARQEQSVSNTHIFCACSALKRSYRLYLRNTLRELLQDIPCRFLLLKAEKSVIQERLESRGGHFMSSSLLCSQLETLETLDEEEKAFGDKELDTTNMDTKQVVAYIVHGLLQGSK